MASPPDHLIFDNFLPLGKLFVFNFDDEGSFLGLIKFAMDSFFVSLSFLLGNLKSFVVS
jgi:hypothetical protein